MEDTMNYKENQCSYEEYLQLRISVGWNNFSKVQAEHALAASLYIVTVVEQNQTIGMGRVIGDGMYNTIADVIVHPDFQHQNIGTSILHMLLDYIEKQTPTGGRTSIYLSAEPGKESFYEQFGFKKIPHDFCGSGMRKVFYKEEIGKAK